MIGKASLPLDMHQILATADGKKRRSSNRPGRARLTSERPKTPAQITNRLAKEGLECALAQIQRLAKMAMNQTAVGTAVRRADPSRLTRLTAGVTDLGWRIAGVLNVYRLFIGLGLLSLFFFTRDPRVVGAHAPTLFQWTVAAYLAVAILGAWLASERRPLLVVQTRWLLTLDIIAIVLLMHASGGNQSGLGNLLIISVGASALVLTNRQAVVFAAISALAILGEQTVSQYEGITTASEFTPAGLLGAITFVTALAVRPIARRLRESEALAAQRGVDLANLAELNEYIIQHLRESIVVLDSDDTVRLMNGSAIRHLGIEAASTGRSLKDVSSELYELTRNWRAAGDDTALPPGSLVAADGSTVITPHFAPIGSGRPTPMMIFLEDSSQLAERVQQTKLASLGRLSASIAHEIRNPIGAISHAGQLLAESDRLGGQERRLTDIIHDHCSRVNSIIKNVLQFSRRERTEPEQLELGEWLSSFATEFAASIEEDAGRFGLDIEGDNLVVRMDTSHLHQILWNLCENAVRYAARPEGLILSLHAGRLTNSERPFLEVLDRGPGIDEKYRDNVFEPFFTEAKDGTGLGLFIARELAECNRATLVYRPRDGGGSCFRIVFADPSRWDI